MWQERKRECERRESVEGKRARRQLRMSGRDLSKAESKGSMIAARQQLCGSLRALVGHLVTIAKLRSVGGVRKAKMCMWQGRRFKR